MSKKTQAERNAIDAARFRALCDLTSRVAFQWYTGGEWPYGMEQRIFHVGQRGDFVAAVDELLNESALYDVARRTCLRLGFAWIDPRTGERHEPERAAQSPGSRRGKPTTPRGE